jgi:hypothetical protein
MSARRERGLCLTVKTHYAKRQRSQTEVVKVKAVDRTGHETEAIATIAAVDQSNEPSFPSETLESDSVLQPAMSSYARHKQQEAEEWEAERRNFVRVANSMESPVSFMCSICEVSVDEPIRCLDCSPTLTFCSLCEKKVHSQLLHKPDIWKVRKCLL